LENISNETKDALKSSMTDLANDIVEKVIGYRSEVQGFDGKTVDEILYN
jgi:flagellar biosynthesis/type III secretory pathway protein FliH